LNWHNSLAWNWEPAMYDLVVIGGGAAGRSVAAAAAKVGARVALIEKDRLGDKNSAAVCWPSKGLIQAARLAHRLAGTARFGITTAAPQIDFSAVMAQVRTIALTLAARSSDEILAQNGVEIHRGSAAFSAYDTVQVDGKLFPSHRFVIATGSRPVAPEIPGLAECGYLDADSIWSVSALPESLTVITTEPAGLELAQCFARLGSKVTVLSGLDSILPRDDLEAASLVTQHLTDEGLIVHTGVEVTRALAQDGEKVCTFREKATGKAGEAASAALLVTAGRMANVEGLELETVGIHADAAHGIEVDEYLQTHATRVYAVGDVLLKHFSAHVALQEATTAFQNAVLRIRKKIDYATIPWSTFTDPEVAGVGMTEARAKALEIPCRAYRVGFDTIDLAVIDGQTDGFAKVVATPGGKILGATVAGGDSSMIIHEIALAMAKGLPLQELASAVPIDPSYGCVLRELAVQAKAGKMEKGYIQTALKLFYGFMPRAGSGNGSSDPGMAAAPAASGDHGDGHGH
jgi:pyruvate/2-oxoglutarate dehydrogenase complex dihydrolipoamide dehydrogenase (E3) component